MENDKEIQSYKRIMTAGYIVVIVGAAILLALTVWDGVRTGVTTVRPVACAVFALGEDDLVRVLARVDALGAFLGTDDGANLLVAYKRAANILKIEEKKDAQSYDQQPYSEGKPEQDEEVTLLAALQDLQGQVDKHLGAENFTAAMSEMAKLRGPLDAFFDKVTVNSDDAETRAERLRLLSKIRTVMGAVADFSKIEG